MPKREITLWILTLAVMSLAYTPLMYAWKERSYWNSTPLFEGALISSGDYSESMNGHIVMGDVERGETSWGAWKIVPHILPFMSENMKRATNVYVIVSEPNPVIQLKWALSSIWEDSDFQSTWTLDGLGATSSNFSTNGDIVTLAGAFSAGIAGSVWIWKAMNTSIFTDDTFYIVFRARVDDEVNSNWLVQIVYKDGSMDHWTGRNTYWITIVKKLTQGKTIESLNLRVENHREAAWTGSGIQYAYFDHVSISSALVVPRARITLNDVVIFDEKPNLENSETSLLLTSSILDKKIAIDINLVKIENLLNISLDGHAYWNISSVAMQLNTRIDQISPPIWQLIPNLYAVFLVFFPLDVAIGFLLLRKFYKWFSAIEHSNRG